MPDRTAEPTPPNRPPGPAARRPPQWRRQRRLAAAIAMLTVVAIGGPALAYGTTSHGTTTGDTPLRAGTYTGAVANYGETKYVTVTVPAHGAPRVTLTCGGVSEGTSTSATQHGGAITAVRSGPNGQPRWTLTGNRTALGDAPDVLQVHLDLPVACDSIGGSGFLAAS